MDLIDRHVLIERIHRQREHLNPSEDARDYIGDAAYRICVEIVERLPSAEPDLQPTCNQLATEIIRCKDCKHRFLQNGIWQCPFTIPASENHFCGYAERRTDG